MFRTFNATPALKKMTLAIALGVSLVFCLQACTVVKVVDLAASTTIGVAKGTVKATGAVVGAAIPDGDDDDKEKD